MAEPVGVTEAQKGALEQLRRADLAQRLDRVVALEVEIVGDRDGGGGAHASSFLNTARAALNPHMPCAPAPGGVAAEQM